MAMNKALGTILLAMAVQVWMPACANRPVCDKIMERNHDCADALVLIPQKAEQGDPVQEPAKNSGDMNKEDRKRFGETLKKRLTSEHFRFSCEFFVGDRRDFSSENVQQPPQSYKAARQALEKCNAMASCDQYALCLVKAYPVSLLLTIDDGS